MAVKQVQRDGNAPEGTKPGDIVVTNGKSYEVLDPAKYSGMSQDQLAQNGVSYNPSSGLYSKVHSSVGSSDYAPLDYSGINNWLDTANKKVKAQLQSAYNTNAANLKRSYNEANTAYKKQADQAQYNYINEMLRNQNQAYYDMVAQMQGASTMGMANSAQAQAAANSSMYQASETMADTNRERAMVINQIEDSMNTLLENYNIQLDELERSRLSDEIAALSDNEIQYLAQMMNIDQYNTDAYNQVMSTKQTQDWQAEQSELARQFEAEQNQLNRDLQWRIANLSYSGGGGGNGSRNGSNGGDGTVTLDDGTQIILPSDSDAFDQYLQIAFPSSVYDQYAREIGLAQLVGTPEAFAQVYKKMYDTNEAKKAGLAGSLKRGKYAFVGTTGEEAGGTGAGNAANVANASTFSILSGLNGERSREAAKALTAAADGEDKHYAPLTAGLANTFSGALNQRAEAAGIDYTPREKIDLSGLPAATYTTPNRFTANYYLPDFESTALHIVQPGSSSLNRNGYEPTTDQLRLAAKNALINQLLTFETVPSPYGSGTLAIGNKVR